MDAREELLAKHRKEKRDLVNRITGMKKQATKAKRKEVNSKCEQLEQELREKHEQELKELDGEGGEVEEVTPEQLLAQLQVEDDGAKEANEANEAKADKEAKVEPSQQPKKKRNRQKEKLARREAEIARMKEEAKKEAAEQPDLKKIEQDAIWQLCQMKGLVPYDIQPDGHCLFASILDQVKTRHGDPQTEMDVHTLRCLACDYILEHRDEFIPYLFDEATMSLKDIDEYTEEMKSTAKWGGEVEILALSKALDCPISVLMSGQATHTVNETGSKPELKLVYYKHTYALGEHYNSLRDSKI